MGLGKQIKQHRLARGWTLEKLEEASGVATGTIHALEARDSSRSQYFAALAKALGLSIEQLADTTPPSSAWVVDISSNINKVEEPRASYGLAPILAWEHETDLPPGEFVMVPKLDVRLSAGGGVDQVEIELAPQTPQAFRAEWIRGKGLKPRLLAAMTASGDSMDPTICDGDSLLVNTGEAEVTDGKVYALWYDGGERVKRLFRLPGGGLRIKSDNPEYGPIELGADYHGIVRIIGRVIHRSGTGGL